MMLFSMLHCFFAIMQVSVRAIRGGRFTMEDEYFVGNGGRFAAVFDGHGGPAVSQFLKHRLYPEVNHYLEEFMWEESDVDVDRADAAREDGDKLHRIPSVSCYVSALRAAFEQVEKEIIEDDDLSHQGSTAVAVVLHESEDGHRTLLSANVGDSRAVLSRKGRAVDLTHDHKPNDEKEKSRIMAMGENIEWDQDCKVHRIRNLSLARAIGDRYAKPAVSPEVDIRHFPVSEEEDEFIILASDGLWDVMSSQDAVTFVHEYLKANLANMSKDNAESYKLVLRRNMAKFIARQALRLGSADNVTVLLVWL